jgi:dGTPase
MPCDGARLVKSLLSRRSPFLIDHDKRNDRRHTITRGKRSDPNDSRTPAQKDRDRLLYTSSLRRLAQVTQVVAADVSHVFHNRLTHSFQVAQVGRRLAERLRVVCSSQVAESDGLDPDAVEAACYAHDLGHPPFGHIVEEELNELAGNDLDGFEGNAQSFRIITRLSQHSPLHRGLDLSRATLAAVLKYPWRRGENREKQNKWGAYHSENKDFDFAVELSGNANRSTLEAKLMDWADDITYSVHDLDDFYRAHRIPLHLLAARLYAREREVFFEAALRRHPDRSGPWADSKALAESFNQVMVGLFPLNNSYNGTWTERASLRQFTSQLIGRYIGGTSLEIKGKECVLKIDDHLLREVAMLKELTWVYVIEAPALVSQQFGQRYAIRKLFEIYMDAAREPKRQNLFPAFYRDALDDAKGEEKQVKRTVIDLIAGMTEDQALAMYTRLVGVSVGSGLEEIVR